MESSVPMEISTELAIPLPNGSVARFHLQESPIMEPELAARFPEIKTYLGQGIDDPSATMRMDITPRGLHAIIHSAEGVVYVDPYWRDDDKAYVSYFKKDFVEDEPFRCLVEAETKRERREGRSREAAAQRPTGATLRKYRLALACTGEYAVRVCSPNAATVPGTLAAIVTSVNRCSAIYEREFAIRFLLVANTDKLIYLDGSTDPYTNSNGFAMLGQNQSNTDTVIGSANYDLGHVFSTDDGGVANLGVVCSSSKARGVTGRNNPFGDPFDVDYVVHEIGHQFDADHPFNGSSGNCDGFNRNGSTAYEVGSGTTIMAYAGICEAQDLALHSDDYFHTVSYDQIDSFTSIGNGANCPESQSTGNNPPSIAALTPYTIPSQTPFALTASATDPNGDTLTYCWEEFDLGAAQDPTADPRDNGASPIFRSFPPTTSATRLFPSLTYILNNANVPPPTVGDFASGEFLPTTTRAMTFRVTVRDNRAGGGGSNYATTTVSSVSTAGPFALTAPNAAATLAGGSNQTVTWNAANTESLPVSCANVKISLSTDGGHTFPIVLAETVPNNGSAEVTIPNTANVATTQGRIKVEAIGNIFFDVSDANLTITSTNPPPTLNVTGPINLVRGALPGAVATVGTASSVNDPLSVSVSDLPYGITINPSISAGSITLGGLADCRVVTTLSSRTYPITLTVTDSAGSTTSGTVNVVIQPNPTPTLGSYSASNVTRGNSIVVSPGAPPADANNNLPPAPFTVTPTVVPGGGTISIDQSTGAVTIATTSGSSTGAIPIRVSLADSCGATAIKDFTINVVVPPSISSLPPSALVVVGSPYNFVFTATGSPAPTFSLTSGVLPPGLTLSSTGVLSGTSTSAGNGTFPNITVTASNGVLPNASQTFSLTAVTRVANYLASFGLNGSKALVTAEPDFDGIPNLIEYALGSNPSVPGVAALPAVTINDYGGTEYLVITFNRSSVATDLTYTVEATSDFVTWTHLASSTGGAAMNGPGLVGETGSAPTFNAEVRDTVPVFEIARFIRLRVSTP